MSRLPNTPPRIAELLIRLLARREDSAFVDGDFREEFDDRVVRFGPREARAWYWRETLRSLGPLLRNRLQSHNRPSAPSASSGAEPFRELFADAKYVLRSLTHSPALAVAIALTLGLGIGAAATMYGVVDRLLIRGPEHVADPGSLRRIYAQVRSKGSGDFTTSYLGYASYTTIRDRARSVTGTAAYNVNQGQVGRGVDALSAQVGSATADFFPLLGVRPALGRFFNTAEDTPPDGQRVVVLDYGYWQRQFAGDPAAIGRTITVNDQLFT